MSKRLYPFSVVAQHALFFHIKCSQTYAVDSTQPGICDKQAACAAGLFIIGTGTDIGKTYVSGLIVKKLRESGRRAGYYKAAVSAKALQHHLKPDWIAFYPGSQVRRNGCLIDVRI